ncbi:hypothetical protein, partial [Klebsiella pneumoniae]|uniref:hypothetical protein n=1 Tax=Klebsiella pneumoniae TaxID=573 RepID=UPI001C92E0E9
ADRNRSHWSTSKTPSYTKSVSWQHHRGYFVLSRNKQYAQNRIIYCDASVAVRVICRAAQQQQPDNAGKQRI